MKRPFIALLLIAISTAVFQAALQRADGQVVGKKDAAADEDPLPDGAIARFGSARLRHGRRVNAVQFSKDGKRLYSASDDFTARIWDAATGRELTVLMTGTQGLIDVAELDDGRKIAVTIKGAGAAIFDAESQQRTWRQDSSAYFGDIDAAPGGETFAAAGTPGVIVKTADDQTDARRLKSVSGKVNRLAFSPDGKLLAVVAGNVAGQIDWIDWKQDERRARTQIEGVVVGIAMRGRLGIFSSLGGDGETSHLWRVDLDEKEKKAERLEAPALTKDQRVTGLALSPDGQVIYAVGSSGEIRAFDIKTGKLPFAADARHDPQPSCLAISPDGKTLATGGPADQAIRLWDSETGQEKTLGLTPSRSALFDVSVSSDGRVVAAGNGSELLTIWDGKTGRTLHEIEHAGDDKLLRAAVSPDGRLVASSGINGMVMWDVATGKQAFRIDAPERIHPVRFSRDGKRLFAGGCGGNLYVYDVQDRELLQTIKAHAQEIWSLDVSPDGSMIATASFDKTAAIFDVATGREIARRSDFSFYVRSNSFSPDGLCVATAGDNDNAIFVWDVASGELIYKLAPEWPATSLAWCERGRVLVSAHSYDRLHFWDMATGKWLGWSRRRPGTFNWKIAASRDMRTAYTAGSDSAVLQWDVAQLAEEMPPLKAPGLTADDLEAAWGQLAARDSATAHRAVWKLAAEGDRAIAMLAGKLTPAEKQEVDEAAVGRLVRQLDDDQFSVREAATRQLAGMAADALPILEEALKKTESVEVRIRLTAILDQVKGAGSLLSLAPGELQSARALQVLLYHDSTASRRLLETVARGDTDTLPARTARSILKRLGD